MYTTYRGPCRRSIADRRGGPRAHLSMPGACATPGTSDGGRLATGVHRWASAKEAKEAATEAEEAAKEPAKEDMEAKKEAANEAKAGATEAEKDAGNEAKETEKEARVAKKEAETEAKEAKKEASGIGFQRARSKGLTSPHKKLDLRTSGRMVVCTMDTNGPNRLATLSRQGTGTALNRSASRSAPTIPSTNNCWCGRTH